MSQSLMKTAILLLRLLLHGLLPPASSAASVGVDVAAADDDDDDNDGNGNDVSDYVRLLLPAFSSEIRQPRFFPLSLAVMSSMLRVHALLRLAAATTATTVATSLLKTAFSSALPLSSWSPPLLRLTRFRTHLRL